MATTSPPWAKIIHQAVDSNIEAIKTINYQIHSEPELAYEEHKAHANFVSLLESLGFQVTPHAYGVATAFSAEYGAGGRLVVFNAEYDALPGIGHACGHNLIASAGLAAFLGVAAALRQTATPGRVRLLGTPAEEGGGGKIHLINNGAYREAAACLMTHPGPQYLLSGDVTGVAAVKMLANVKWRIFFTGQTAHAAMEPWNGLNALDAVCLSYNAISMLRQQIRPHERIHGVIKEGGDRPNVIPGSTSVDYYIRSDTLAAAERLWTRVKLCFEGAAIATGCQVRYEPINSYADLRSSMALCKEFVATLPQGTVSLDEPADFLAGSTDMGNVTYECPGFHGAFGIDTERGQGNHTRPFADASGLERSLDRAVEWGKSMALVGYRVLSDDDFNREVQEDWKADMKRAAL
ncbi:peptidase dimerization domain protein [Cordyceps militaris CM01]|uniref:Peptidase M20 domain-containing protein 2 n=1 Tax=Cordyceps militaris (strain CM01) TaxID=983644 RepID=G3JSV3_CORMM|nr:peptidase dimerization domain protein [Cordyceps militaris CM01]EGX88949.1 peptidase dimerization domain protein [Cordyceps militaris CM01]